MKKYLPAAPLLSLFLGSIAMLLRLWFLSAGESSTGLLPRNHPGQICTYVLSLLAVALFWFLSRQIHIRQPQGEPAAASVPGAAGYLTGAAGLLLSSLLSLLSGGDKWQLASDIIGITAGLCLAWGGLLRLQGRKMPFVIHAVPTLFFALRVFLMGKILGAEPEIARFILQFLASLAMLPAMYQLWGRDVAMENDRKIWFWSASCSYLCLAATLGSREPVLYLAMAAMFLTNLPDSKPEAEPDMEPVPEDQEPELP